MMSEESRQERSGAESEAAELQKFREAVKAEISGFAEDLVENFLSGKAIGMVSTVLMSDGNTRAQVIGIRLTEAIGLLECTREAYKRKVMA